MFPCQWLTNTCRGRGTPCYFDYSCHRAYSHPSQTRPGRCARCLAPCHAPSLSYMQIYDRAFSKQEAIDLVQLLWTLLILPDLDIALQHRIARSLRAIVGQRTLLKPRDLELSWRPLVDLVIKHHFPKVRAAATASTECVCPSVFAESLPQPPTVRACATLVPQQHSHAGLASRDPSPRFLTHCCCALGTAPS